MAEIKWYSQTFIFLPYGLIYIHWVQFIIIAKSGVNQPRLYFQRNQQLPTVRKLKLILSVYKKRKELVTCVFWNTFRFL